MRRKRWLLALLVVLGAASLSGLASTVISDSGPRLWGMGMALVDMDDDGVGDVVVVYLDTDESGGLSEGDEILWMRPVRTNPDPPPDEGPVSGVAIIIHD